MWNYFQVKDCGYTESIANELNSIKPDALFLDFDYPDRSGLRLLQELKQKYASLPVLMATIQHSEELAVWALRSGVLDYFAKPIAPEDLRRCQKRLMEIQQLKRRQKNRSASKIGHELPVEAAPVQSTDMRAIEPALHYVSQHYQDKITRDNAAALCSMTPFQFTRRFREACGIPFRDYVVRHRIREACRLLENPTTSITNVAFAVGFNDVGYFCRMFKRYTGVTPTALREELSQASTSAYKLLVARELAEPGPEVMETSASLLPPLPTH